MYPSTYQTKASSSLWVLDFFHSHPPRVFYLLVSPFFSCFTNLFLSIGLLPWQHNHVLVFPIFLTSHSTHFLLLLYFSAPFSGKFHQWLLHLLSLFLLSPLPFGLTPIWTVSAALFTDHSCEGDQWMLLFSFKIHRSIWLPPQNLSYFWLLGHYLLLVFLYHTGCPSSVSLTSLPPSVLPPSIRGSIGLFFPCPFSFLPRSCHLSPWV